MSGDLIEHEFVDIDDPWCERLAQDLGECLIDGVPHAATCIDGSWLEPHYFLCHGSRLGDCGRLSDHNLPFSGATLTVLLRVFTQLGLFHKCFMGWLLD